MKKSTAVWLIIAIVLIFVGGILFGSALVMQKEKLGILSTSQYTPNIHQVQEAFRGITVEALSADVKIVPSTDGKVTVTCLEMENCKHSVAVENGTLMIRVQDQRKWYDYIGFHFTGPAITVALPDGDYGEFCIKTDTGDVTVSKEITPESLEVNATTGDVRIYCAVPHFIRVVGTTGNIRVENTSVKVMNLRTGTGKITVNNIQCQGRITAELTTGDIRLRDIESEGLVVEYTTGDVRLENITCDWIESKGDTGKAQLETITCGSVKMKGTTGDAVLSNVLAETITINRTTGDVVLQACDADRSLILETTTGNITGTLLTGKWFYPETETGNVDVPYLSETKGTCGITTTTGDVKIEVMK